MTYPLAEEKLDKLPFKDISWKKFEKICTDLLSTYELIEEAREYLNQGDPQEGIDVYAFDSKNDAYISLQCKNVKTFGPIKIQEAVKRFVDGSFYHKSKKFILATRKNLGTKACEVEIQKQRTFLLSNGIKLWVWDERRLNRLLKRHPLIVYDAFDYNVVEKFNGRAYAQTIQESIKIKLPPPIKLTYPPVANYISRSVSALGDANDFGQYYKRGETLTDLIDKNAGSAGYYLLLSEGGEGKSVELSNIANYYSASAGKLYPIKIELRDYSENTNIEGILSSVYPNWDRLDNSQLLLLFDGLDEVTQNLYNDFIKKLNLFVTGHSEVTVIISSRTNFYDVQNTEGQLRDFSLVTLNKLTYTDVTHYAHIHLSLETDRFLQLVQERELNELIHTPFYLIELVKLFQQNKTSSFPQSKTNIIEAIIDQIMIREDIKFALNSSYPSTSKEYKMWLIRKVAFSMTLMGINTIAKKDAEKLFLKDVDGQNLKYTLLQSKNGAFQFPHNLLQEHLAATCLVDLDVDAVIKMATYAPDGKKIKSKWYNTLSFYILLLENNTNKYRQFIDWLVDNELEVIINLEANKLDADLRFELFRNIIDKYRKKEIYFPNYYFDEEKLVRFVGKTKMVLEYLIHEIKSGTQPETKIHCLDLLKRFDNYFNLEAKIKDVLLGLSVTKNETPRIQNEAIKNIAKLGVVIDIADCYDYIITHSKNINNYIVRKGIHRLISVLPLEGKHLDFVFKSVDFINKEPRSTNVVLGEEYPITNILLSSEEPELLIKIFKFISKRQVLHYDRHSNFTLNTEFFKKFIPKCVRAYQLDRTIFRYVANFIRELRHSHVDRLYLEEIGKFFVETQTTVKAFLYFYKQLDNIKNRWRVVEMIMPFADWPCLMKVYKDYVNGKIPADFVFMCRSGLQDGSRDLHDRFYKYINDKSNGKFEYAPPSNWKDQRVIQEEYDQELLLNKNLFFSEVEALFHKAETATLSKDILWEYKKGIDEDSLNNTVVLDLLRDWAKKDGSVNIDYIKEVYADELRWEHYVVNEIFSIVYSERELKPELKKIAIDYFVKYIPQQDFKSAIRNGENLGQYTYTYFSGQVTHFSSLWDLDWSDDILLDLLYVDTFSYFDRISTPERKERPLDYVLRKISDPQKVRKRVLENLRSGDLAQPVLGSHFRLCERLQITEGKNFIYKELALENFPSYGKIYIVEIYLKIGGTWDDILSIYESYTTYDDWFWYLSENLVQNFETIVYQKLITILKDVQNTDQHSKAGLMLLKLGRYESIEYFCEQIRKTHSAPFNYRNWDKLGKQKFPVNESLKSLFDVLVIPFSQELPNQKQAFETLDQAITVLINHIGLQSDYAYQAAIEQYGSFITKYRSKYKRVKNLQYTIDSFERNYYKNKEENISIEDSIKISASIGLG